MNMSLSDLMSGYLKKSHVPPRLLRLSTPILLLCEYDVSQQLTKAPKELRTGAMRGPEIPRFFWTVDKPEFGELGPSTSLCYISVGQLTSSDPKVWWMTRNLYRLIFTAEGHNRLKEKERQCNFVANL